MLAVLQGCLEAILSEDTLALKHSDVLEPALPQLFKLSVHVGQAFVLLFRAECAARLFHFWNCIHGPLHSINFQGTGDILIQLWLPNLAEQEKFGAMLLFMRVDPEERKRAVGVQWQGKVLAVEGLMGVRRPNFIIQVSVLLL